MVPEKRNSNSTEAGEVDEDVERSCEGVVVDSSRKGVVVGMYTTPDGLVVTYSDNVAPGGPVAPDGPVAPVGSAVVVVMYSETVGLVVTYSENVALEGPVAPDGPDEPVGPTHADGPDGPDAPDGPDMPDGPEHADGPCAADAPVDPVGDEVLSVKVCGCVEVLKKVSDVVKVEVSVPSVEVDVVPVVVVVDVVSLVVVVDVVPLDVVVVVDEERTVASETVSPKVLVDVCNVVVDVAFDVISKKQPAAHITWLVVKK